ncbi:uncharacterized protein LOC143908567 [Temnothorax americanus]|uniref:uncharacterized protein LOC143908567 n=1 Tax=Temnothorax americanus TaxID=1964332 RepID=UPI004069012A
MAEATNSNHDANNVNDNAPITPEEIDEEINRLNRVLSQRGTPANHRNRIPARAGPPRDDRDSILDEILNGIRNLQDRVNQLKTANPERREFHARREPSNLPFEVTYGRTSYDIRNQAERAIGYLRLKEARDMIPEFDGTSSKLQEFLSAASYAIKNINPMEEGTLLEAVLCTKLKGRAMIDFQTREIRDFAQLKKELEVCYLSRKSTTHLQLEFNTLKQKPGENARAFGLRADKLAMELYDSMIEERNHTIESKRTILETIQQQALQNFQLGLRDEIKLLVRAQHFATLQEAIAGASAEEKVNGPSGIPPRPKNNYAYSPQPRDNRSIVQCQKCGKYGHLGRECRTNRYANRFSLPKPDRTPRVNAIDKVCNYCKKAGHMREECWLLNGRPNKERTNHNKPNNPRGQNKNFRPKTNGPRKKDSNSAANSDEEDKEDTKQRRPALEYQMSHLTNKPRKHAGLDLITLPMQEAKHEKINLLFDTGAAVSIIKVKHLKGKTMIEEDKMALTGVTGHKAHTIGKFTATIDLKNRKIKHTIYVVKDDFPIEYDGILGVDFIKKHRASYSYESSAIRIGNSTLKLYPYKKIVLKPRSETIVQVATDKNLLGIIQAEETMPGVFIGNCLVMPENFLCPASILNMTEKTVEMLMPQVTLKELEQEEAKEIEINQVNKAEETMTRSEKVEKLIRTQHLNEEEKKTIMEICRDYSDVLHVEGEPLTCTDIVAHKITTKAGSVPVNVRPYRLPEKHKEEVNRQVKEMLKNGIIRPSTSPWNAPLLVVPKKRDA